MTHHAGDPDLERIESIYDALDRGQPEQALELAHGVADAPTDPVLHLLAGVALLELDRPAEALIDLERAAELDPADAEILGKLALASFLCCRFDAAAGQIARALVADDKLPEAHYVQALLRERAGDEVTAERHYARAAALAPEAFPPPVRLDRETFEARLQEAMERLPGEYRRHLDQVVVTVEDLPSDEILADGDPPLDPEGTLGLFVGVSRDRESSLGPGGELPARILLFKKNLERLALSPAELSEEIAVTLYHELGHYLGLDEDELADIDLA